MDFVLFAGNPNLAGEGINNINKKGDDAVGVLIPLNPGHRCENTVPDGEEVKILSEKHKEILDSKLENLIKLGTTRDIETVRRGTLKKLEDVHSSKDFIVKMSHRIKLLYQLLFDSAYPKSRTTEKTITAGLFYFVSPGDFFSDEIPGLGYLDDAYIIKKTCEKTCPEIQDYLKINDLQNQFHL